MNINKIKQAGSVLFILTRFYIEQLNLLNNYHIPILQGISGSCTKKAGKENLL
jgi:hypothetical protein